MIEKYYPAREPKWPVNFTVGVKSKAQAEILACCLIRIERALRKPIRRGDFKNMYVADSIAVARRKLQEDAGLVASAAEVDEIVRRNLLERAKRLITERGMANLLEKAQTMRIPGLERMISELERGEPR